jgi:APA family basic amino acid/polyamine antiporter
MLIVTALYLIMNVAYAYVLPIDTMAQSRLVAADVAEKCRAGGGRWIALAVMISTSGAANATILTTARGVFLDGRAAASSRSCSGGCIAVSHSAASLVVQGIWSAVLIFSGTFDTLTDTLIFVSWLFYATAPLECSSSDAGCPTRHGPTGCQVIRGCRRSSSGSPSSTWG